MENLSEKLLKNGQDFSFDNEKWCELNQSDDFRGGWLTWNDRFQNFALFFNGECLHVSKTFSSSKKRLEKLFFKWNLEQNLES